jgi:hypothetical protein
MLLGQLNKTTSIGHRRRFYLFLFAPFGSFVPSRAITWSLEGNLKRENVQERPEQLSANYLYGQRVE